jgi:hypothetical protein
MKKDTPQYHIEHIYPDKRKRTLLVRGSIIIGSSVAVIGLYAFLIIPAFFSKIRMLGLIPALLLIPFTIIPWVWTLVDNYRFFKTPHTAYMSRAKVLITTDYISVLFGNREMRKLIWEEVEIIEKTRYQDESVILIITNKWHDRAIVCDDKQKNYIMLPARYSLEKTIEKFSDKKITLADSETYRFVKS